MTLIEARNTIFAADPTRSVCVTADCYRHPALGSGQELDDNVRYVVTIHNPGSPGVSWQKDGHNLSALVADALAWLRDPHDEYEDPQVGDEVAATVEAKP